MPAHFVIFVDEDIWSNAVVSDPVPSAPPLEKMDAIPGYNNLGFDTGILP